MIIQGKRIIIYETQRKHLPILLTLWNDGCVMKWVGFKDGLNYTMEKMEQWYNKMQESTVCFHFMVYEDVFFCGELFYKKDLRYKRAGLDIKFRLEAQGKGLATEALESLINYVFENEEEIDAVWTEPSTENSAARKLYAKCGLKPEERPKDMEPAESYWELTRKEWLKKKKKV